MRVYPASRSRELTNTLVAALEAAGHVVTHNWATGAPRKYDESDVGIAMTDIFAMDRAQAIVLMWTPGIRAANTELGYCLGRNRLCILVGCEDVNENIFYRLPNVFKVANIEEALKLLDNPPVAVVP